MTSIGTIQGHVSNNVVNYDAYRQIDKIRRRTSKKWRAYGREGGGRYALFVRFGESDKIVRVKYRCNNDQQNTHSISNIRRVLNVVWFLLGNSRGVWILYADVSERSVPSSYIPAFEDGTDRVFRNVGIQNSDAGELPRRKHTTECTLFTLMF